MRTADTTHGGGRAVLFVVRMQDEEDVERALERRIRPILQFRGAEQHVQEISAVAQIVVGVYEWHPQTVPVGERGNRRHFADQAIRLFEA